MTVPVQVRRLTTEYLTDPVGLDEPRPRFGWQLQGDRPGLRQTARHIRIEGFWDSGEVDDDRSCQVVYDGPPLEPRTAYTWQVRVRDEAGSWSEWSRPAVFETGRMTALAGSPWLIPPHGAAPMEPARYLRRAFILPGEIRRARLYMSALGMYIPSVNGRRITANTLMPGWTDYFSRVQYQAYDVGEFLRPGANVLGAILNEGWYAGRIARHYSGEQPTYGERPALWWGGGGGGAGGERIMIRPDGEWRYTAAGPIRMADIYMGIDYDATLEMPGWDAPEFDAASWLPAPCETIAAPLVWNAAPPVRTMETLAPAAIRRHGDACIVDFGQNLAGRERFIFAGLPRGRRVVIRHGEMLRGDGSLYTANLRTARAATVYTAKGAARESFEPEFTWYGFRYLEITGLDSPRQIERLEALVIHSAMPVTGSFECSDELVNRLFRNIQWSQKSNFIDIPSDCPQRDERYGWSGDAQVFIPAAAGNMEVAPFFAKWLEDLKSCRNAKGAYPHYAPYYMPKDPPETAWDTIIGAPGWGDAGVVCPWELYCRYGDRRILERHYEAMTGWIDFLETESPNGIRDVRLYGDWLNLHADLPNDFVATAWFAYSAGLVGRIAGILGREADRRRYAGLAARVRAAFGDKFVPYGTLIYRTQSACALILAFDLVAPEYRAGILKVLVEDIVVLRHGHMSTGFLGTPLLCRALSDSGRADIAYRLLRQTGYPGWLYPVLQGATTVWERLNSYTREGGFGDESMNSFNHYSYGSVAAWLYEGVAGLRADPEHPGYRRFRLAPLPGGGLSYARMSCAVPAGRIESNWEIAGETVRFEVLVPPNSGCVFVFPSEEGEECELPPGRHVLSLAVERLRADLRAGAASERSPSLPKNPKKGRSKGAMVQVG